MPLQKVSLLEDLSRQGFLTSWKMERIISCCEEYSWFERAANNASMFALYAGSFSIKSKGTGTFTLWIRLTPKAGLMDACVKVKMSREKSCTIRLRGQRLLKL